MGLPQLNSNMTLMGTSRIGMLESIKRQESNHKLLTPGLSFTVDKMDMRPFNSSDNRIVEVDEAETPVKKPAYSAHNGNTN